MSFESEFCIKTVYYSKKYITQKIFEKKNITGKVLFVRCLATLVQIIENCNSAGAGLIK